MVLTYLNFEPQKPQNVFYYLILILFCIFLRTTNVKFRTTKAKLRTTKLCFEPHFLFFYFSCKM